MAMIVLMEDDAATRLLVSSVLKKEGHNVLAAEDGAQGLLLTRARKPDLVISDIQMPLMNGFQVLTALRQDAELAMVPVILLTSLLERAHMRIGMTSGADDYITKPFRTAELREAVAAQLNKRQVHASLQALAVDRAVHTALSEQREQLIRLYERRLAKELSDRWPMADSGLVDKRFDTATALFVDIPHYARLAEILGAVELSELVRRFYSNANDTAHLFGAAYMQFIGEGLLAVFTNDSNTTTVNHGLRAARTALALVESAYGIGRALQASQMPQALPDFSATVALNSGPISIVVLKDPLHGHVQRLPVGDTVSAAMLLQKQAAHLRWAVAASVSTVRMTTGGLHMGRRALIDLPGRSQPIDAAELTGLAL